MGQLAAKAYDRFRVELSNVVVVLAEVRRGFCMANERRSV